MIKITKTEVFGFDAAIRGMRNPMNSWYSSDSSNCVADCAKCTHLEEAIVDSRGICFYLGDADRELACKLVKAGSDHRKFMRMIHVQADVLAPLYWWKEYDTYKISTVANSCSTMHKIHARDFTIDDFSFENCDSWVGNFCEQIVQTLNICRTKYLDTKDKKVWYQMIQLLPSSYNQKRTIDLNYETLYNIYHARKNHKLDEWHTFCDWIEKLPYMKEFLG